MRSTNGISPYVFPGLIKTFEKLAANRIKAMNPEEIDREVCNSFGINTDELRTKTRKKDISEPRQICIALRILALGQTESKAGQFYLRDHSTSHHAKINFLNHYEIYRDFKEMIDVILRNIGIEPQWFQNKMIDEGHIKKHC